MGRDPPPFRFAGWSLPPGNAICGLAPPGYSTLPVVRVTPGRDDAPPGCRTLPKVLVAGMGLMKPPRFCAYRPVATSSAKQNPPTVLMDLPLTELYPNGRRGGKEGG